MYDIRGHTKTYDTHTHTHRLHVYVNQQHTKKTNCIYLLNEKVWNRMIHGLYLWVFFTLHRHHHNISTQVYMVDFQTNIIYCMVLLYDVGLHLLLLLLLLLLNQIYEQNIYKKKRTRLPRWLTICCLKFKYSFIIIIIIFAQRHYLWCGRN